MAPDLRFLAFPQVRGVLTTRAPCSWVSPSARADRGRSAGFRVAGRRVTCHRLKTWLLMSAVPARAGHGGARTP